MLEKWDTIVVGSGMGGLTAAAHLVKTGLRVLILERNPHPGGTAYVYHRKGFTFPMGPLGFSEPGLVQDSLKDLRVGDGIRLSRVHYRIRAFGLDIPLSLPFPEMVKELGGLFLTEAQGVEQFFKSIEEMISKPNQRSGISASEYLKGLIKDWRLRRILGSIGTREPYSSLPLLAAMWNLMCKEGIWYPIEGMQSFCERLVKAVKRNFDRQQNDEPKRENSGMGEIRLNREVAEIRVENGRVLGVTLKDDTQIDSDSVISNADYKNTFVRLMGPEMVPREWYEAVSTAKQTGSIFQVCLGIDTRKVNLSAFKKASRIIFRRDPKDTKEETLHWDAVEIDPEALASQELEVSLWGGDEKITSSGKKEVIVIRVEAEHRHFARYRSVSPRRIPEYQVYKTRLGRALIHEIEYLIPGLEESIFVMDIATPLTFEDQGGRSEGAVAGWSWDYEDFRDDKPKELIRTPIKGLYMVGYQAFSALFMGGVPTAMESGRRAAQATLDGAGPIEDIWIPGGK
jgi:ferredoxin--NADP+ reductase